MSSNSIDRSHQSMADESSVPTFESEGLLRIILVGKTGVGKSCVGNVLLERKNLTLEEKQNASHEGFVVCHGMESGTERCCSKLGHNTLLDRSFKIIDTPGLYDTNSGDLMKALKEFTKLLSLSVPGPHAILFLVRCDVKFTKEEEEAFMKIKKMFGDEVLKHMVIVFTHGDQLKISKDVLINRVPETLKKILEFVENKYTFMSQTEDIETKRKELKDLLIIIDKVNNHGTKYYADNFLVKINNIIEEEEKARMTAQNISHTNARRIIMSEINNDIWDQRFMQRLLSIVLHSPAFAILIGLTVLSILALPFIRTEDLEFATLTAMTEFLSSGKIQGHILRVRSRCTIL